MPRKPCAARSCSRLEVPCRHRSPANLEGADFGIVSHLFSTGANDVLVARGDRERMIPFLQPDFVTSVDFDTGVITVDWDADF